MSHPEPPEVAGIDVSNIDPTLRNAPLPVKKAGAWLEQQKPFRVQRAAMASGLVGLLVFSPAIGGLVATLAGNEPVGVLAMVASFAVAGVGTYAMHRAWGRTQAWATNLVTRWHQLEEMGIPADLVPEGEKTTSALDRMVARIDALAGDREPVREAARKAVERARRLEAELEHLKAISTGNPEADAALDVARERIATELARTRARVAEVYAGLVELETAKGGQDDLEQALTRVASELEVEDRNDAARRAKQAARAGVVR